MYPFVFVIYLFTTTIFDLCLTGLFFRRYSRRGQVPQRRAFVDCCCVILQLVPLSPN